MSTIRVGDVSDAELPVPLLSKGNGTARMGANRNRGHCRWLMLYGSGRYPEMKPYLRSPTMARLGIDVQAAKQLLTLFGQA